MMLPRFLLVFLLLGLAPWLVSCAFMSEAGPKKHRILGKSIFGKKGKAYDIVEVKSVADVPSKQRFYGVGQVPPTVKGSSYQDAVRTRDSLFFTITDLAESSPFFTQGNPYGFGPIEVPKEGTVVLPYVGEVAVNGLTLSEISIELNKKLKPISNTARASASRTGRIPKAANVIGEVARPGPVTLERENITSLDLLAESGGPRESEHLFKYTLRRNNKDYAFDYIGFRKKSFLVEDGDLLTVNTDGSNRFYVMGAINRPMTVPFPVPSPTLADALGAASGFDENRSDPSGVFIFRKGDINTVYTFDLKNPEIIFLIQEFQIRGEDLVYITEAPLARWSRLINQLAPLSRSSLDIQRANSL